MSGASTTSPAGSGGAIKGLVKDLEARVVASEEKMTELKDSFRATGHTISELKNNFKKNESGIKDML